MAIIRQLNEFYQFGIEIIGCQTIREPDGLAMSSRNLRLSPEDRPKALAISRALSHVREHIHLKELQQVKAEAVQIIENAGLQLEYLDVVDPITLESYASWQTTQVCCVAAFCADVRLIDNMLCESVL